MGVARVAIARAADVRILASSTQLAAIGHQWEKWENFPYELDRLLKLIDRLNVRNMVVISGDMHYGELSSIHTPRGIELFDLTSSGLNHSEPADGIPNRNRRELFDTGINFGLVTVRGTESGPRRAARIAGRSRRRRYRKKPALLTQAGFRIRDRMYQCVA